MKRIIALMLLSLLCVSLLACGGIGDTDSGALDSGSGDTEIGNPYDVISSIMYRSNCKDGYKYDKSVQESNSNWVSRHNNIDLGKLDLYGCEKVENGYKIVNEKDFGLKFKVTQNLGALVSEDGTKNGAESLWINTDNDIGALDTNINSAIGVGAYYIKIKYTDGTEGAVSKTDFFKNAEKGMSLDMLSASNIDSGKTISSVEVTLLYEMYSGGPGLFGVWWHEYTNWRCEYGYTF